MWSPPVVSTLKGLKESWSRWNPAIPKKLKKVGWTEKQQVFCKNHGGLHRSHNMYDCHHFNKEGTLFKKNGGAGKPHLKEKWSEGAYFAQIVWEEFKKYSAWQPSSCTNTLSVMLNNLTYNDSDSSCWSRLYSTREFSFETWKLNNSIKNYTYHGQRKAISQINYEFKMILAWRHWMKKIKKKPCYNPN